MAKFEIIDPTKSRKLTVSAMKARDRLRWAAMGSKSLVQIRESYANLVNHAARLNQFEIRHMYRLVESPDKLELWHYTPEGTPKRIILIVHMIPDKTE